MGRFALLIRRESDGGELVAFSVILLCFHGNDWLDVSRYDTAHGFAHRDVLGVTEGLRGKLPCASLTHEEAFRYAIRDFKENAENYLEDYLAH